MRLCKQPPEIKTQLKPACGRCEPRSQALPSPRFPKAASIVEIPRGQVPKVDSTLILFLPQQRQPGTTANVDSSLRTEQGILGLSRRGSTEAITSMSGGGGLLCQELQEITEPKGLAMQGSPPREKKGLTDLLTHAGVST